MKKAFLGIIIFSVIIIVIVFYYRKENQRSANSLSGLDYHAEFDSGIVYGWDENGQPLKRHDLRLLLIDYDSVEEVNSALNDRVNYYYLKDESNFKKIGIQKKNETFDYSLLINNDTIRLGDKVIVYVLLYPENSEFSLSTSNQNFDTDTLINKINNIVTYRFSQNTNMKGLNSFTTTILVDGKEYTDSVNYFVEE